MAKRTNKPWSERGRIATPEYTAWRNMKARCFNPNDCNYRHYGGRGIKVFPEWIDSFDAFFSYIGRRPEGGYSLDRIDYNGDYAPGNVRWATWEVQENNRRDNRILEYRGRAMTLQQWSREVGIPRDTLAYRMDVAGMDVSEAFEAPINMARQLGGRAVKNPLATWNGRTQTMRQWSDEVGIPLWTLTKRINQYGWSVDKAFSTPTRKAAA